ncbi:MAG TPA: zinc ribbon domain-containing protein [Terrimesophilobacter sp.]|nr:zinc ribbon domain-containing protein [Terrimesophilobacter sp.]HRP99837.1 zinc ribbon domain-containing protein [Terrimesophilobacter sp.]
MPTYSYRCADCGHAFDIQQAFTDDSLTVCPECGGTLRKVFGNIGVTFSGSGFYRTDSRAKPEGSKGDGSKGEGSKSDGTKSEKSTSSTDAGGTKSTPSTSEKSKAAASTTASTSSNSSAKKP